MILFFYQELSEHSQKEKTSPKSLPTQKSPAASSPVSGKATPTFALESPATYTKGRFSICCITAPLPIAEEKDAVAEDVNAKGKNGAQVKTPKSSPINQHDKSILTATPDKLTRSAQLALKGTPLKRRSGAVAIINAKRRSGASSANLLGLFQQLIFNINLNALKYRNKTEVGHYSLCIGHHMTDISSGGFWTCWEQLELQSVTFFCIRKTNC